jgi:hypothetical protein
VAVAAVLATAASAQGRGVQFIEPGTYGDSGPFGFNMTADGSTFVASQGGGAVNCVLWNELTGWTYLTDTQGACYMSADGRQFGSSLDDMDGVSHMARWNGTAMVMVNEHPDLAPCDFFQSDTFGISGDGGTLTGLGWAGCTGARAITSTNDCLDDEGNDEGDDEGTFNFAFGDDEADDCVPGGEMTRYESWVEGRANRMNGANYDGSLLLGWQDTEFGSRYGAYWVGGMGQWICDPADPELFCGEAYDSNTPGTAVAGLNYSDPTTEGISEGWVWYPETGEIKGTGHFPGAFFLDRGANFAVSEDGRTVGGRFGFGPFSSATLWTAETGQINLNQFLIDQGLTEPFDGWFLIQVNDIVGNTDSDGDDEDGDDDGSDDGSSEESHDDTNSDDTDDRFRLVVWAAGPPSPFGNQTIVLDLSTVAVCHDNPAMPGEPRTLTVSWNSALNHVAHGDFLGTCEAAGGGFSRAADHSEHFGVDPTNACFQKSLNDFMNNNRAIAQVTNDAAQKMFAAAESCGATLQRSTPGATEKLPAPTTAGRRGMTR